MNSSWITCQGFGVYETKYKKCIPSPFQMVFCSPNINIWSNLCLELIYSIKLRYWYLRSFCSLCLSCNDVFVINRNVALLRIAGMKYGMEILDHLIMVLCFSCCDLSTNFLEGRKRIFRYRYIVN